MMLGIIPLRKGSKGIKDKNIKEMCGKPLVQWTIDAAKELIPLVITTDYDFDFGVDIIKRHENLCKDDTPMVPVVQHAVKEYERISNVKITSVCLLQPTSPLRTSDDIKNCMFLHGQTGKAISSGYHIQIKEDGKVFDKHKVDKHYQRNGAIFITPRNMLDNGEIFNERNLRYVMPMSRSIDIDSEDDWYIAESLLKRKGEC